MPQIAPSVLNADFSRIEEWLPQFEKAKADAVHWDIMDNEFVPNTGVKWSWILELRPKTRLPFDCHLMVKEPELYIGKMVGMGADSITIHAEATENPKKILELIHGEGLKAGIAINAQTPAEKIVHLLNEADLALVMSVHAGFGGQSFLPEALEKIALLKKNIEREKLDCKIQVDGGINLETGKKAVAVGTDILVAGSFVFKYKSVLDAIQELKRL
jgi:ribulose-phosphate 3-epimerase